MLLLILFSQAINKLKHVSYLDYDQDTFVLLLGVLFLNFKSWFAQRYCASVPAHIIQNMIKYVCSSNHNMFFLPFCFLISWFCIMLRWSQSKGQSSSACSFVTQLLTSCLLPCNSNSKSQGINSTTAGLTRMYYECRVITVFTNAIHRFTEEGALVRILAALLFSFWLHSSQFICFQDI